MRTFLSIPHEVQGNEIDARGTLSPGWVARYFEHSRWAMMHFPDYALMRIKDMKFGVVRAQALEIREALRFRDQVQIGMWVCRVGRTSYDFAHSIRRDDGAVVARGRAVLVYLDGNKPAPLPEAVHQAIHHEPAPVPEAVPLSLIHI